MTPFERATRRRPPGRQRVLQALAARAHARASTATGSGSRSCTGGSRTTASSCGRRPTLVVAPGPLGRPPRSRRSGCTTAARTARSAARTCRACATCGRARRAARAAAAAPARAARRRSAGASTALRLLASLPWMALYDVAWARRGARAPRRAAAARSPPRRLVGRRRVGQRVPLPGRVPRRAQAPRAGGGGRRRRLDRRADAERCARVARGEAAVVRRADGRPRAAGGRDLAAERALRRGDRGPLRRAPGWAQAIVADHEAGHDVVGGPVRNAAHRASATGRRSSSSTPTSWSRPGGAVPGLPGMNVSYDRRAIEAMRRCSTRAAGSRGCTRTCSEGVRVLGRPRRRARPRHALRLPQFVSQRWHYARSHAGARNPELGLKRALYFFGSPLIVPLMYLRIARAVPPARYRRDSSRRAR